MITNIAPRKRRNVVCGGIYTRVAHQSKLI
jgi:hypothetical protein